MDARAEEDEAAGAGGRAGWLATCGEVTHGTRADAAIAPPPSVIGGGAVPFVPGMQVSDAGVVSVPS